MPRELKKILEADNIVSGLEEDEINKYSQQAIQGYQTDDESRADWKKKNKEGMKLAMQIAEQKNFPFEGSSNVMYPLLAISAIQFSSRAYPNLIPGWEVVKGKVIGADESGLKASKAKRSSLYMNYQLNEEMEEWEEETDRLLTTIPITGCCFKETYWSKNLKRNVSTYCSPEDIVMHYKAKSMETVPRITKLYNLYEYEIIERIRAGVFSQFDIPIPSETKEENDDMPSDRLRPHLFIQQSTWLDLDNDGYPEPYILNIHYDTKKLVRIAPRFTLGDINFNDRSEVQKINARKHYTKFGFMPSPDGSIYDWGFGALLGPINHTVNTVTNQLLDAGTWSNTQSGFIGRNISLGRGRAGGRLQVKPNELIPVNYTGEDLRKNIVMINEFMREPSSTLFQLLGFMVNAGEKLSSVTELLMGEQSVQNEPATTSLARIEQGLKVFSSIHKRLHKAFTKEYKLLFDLNSRYMNMEYYYRITDEPEAIQKVMQSDFDKSSCDIIPVSSPDEVSNTQKMMKAQMLMSLRGQGFNDAEIGRRFIEAMQIPDQEAILNAPPPPPNPELEIKMEETRLKREELDLERFKHEFDMQVRQEEVADKDIKLAQEQAKLEEQREKVIAQQLENRLKEAEIRKTEEEIAKIVAEIMEMQSEDTSKEKTN